MRRFLTVTGFTALLTIMRMFTGIIIAKVVAIYAGPTGMAMLGQLQSLIATLSGISNASVGSGLVRYTAENKSNGYDACKVWWRASLQIALSLMVVTIVTCLTFSREIALFVFDNHEYDWIINLAAVCLPLSILNSVVNSILNGLEEYKKYIILGILSLIISTSLMVSLTAFYGIYGMLVFTSFGAGVSGFILFILCIRAPWAKFKFWWGETTPEARQKIGNYALMAITSAIFGPLSLVLVRNTIIAEAGWDSAGQWQSVYRISEVYLAVITTALGTYFLPRLARCKSDIEIVDNILQTLKVVIPMVIFMSLTIYMLRDFIILALFTDSFYGARDLFNFQIIGDVLKVASWVISFPLLSKGMTKGYILSECIANANFVFLTYLFVMHVGVEGANIAYAVNYGCYLIFIAFYMHKKLKLR
ncbi:WzxE protein [Vibrio cholerae]|nr:putative O-antigen flippase [Vibrio cholerae]GHW30903.1 WzxE protein [Vibrio cholerae]